jgi:16S rRNA G966 N2-methylase RsmD
MPKLVLVEADADAVAHWASQIASTWRETIEGILGVAHMLAAAHRDLATRYPPGGWARLTGRGSNPQILPFKYTTAEELRLIGEDERIARYSEQVIHVLPSDWKAIYLLTTLDDASFARAADSGLISPTLTQTKVRSFKRLLRQKSEQAAAQAVVPTYTLQHRAIETVGADIVADNSVQAIVTDPPYPSKFLSTFSHLADFAARTLVPSGWCIVMTGAVRLPDVLNRLCAKLEYRWQYIVMTPGGPNPRMNDLGLFQGYKPVLLFQKPPVSRIREWWSDVIVAKASEHDKALHPWQQSEAVFAELVSRFSQPGGLVVDPFAGSGTTGRVAIAQGRHFWGCDSDPNCCK